MFLEKRRRLHKGRKAKEEEEEQNEKEQSGSISPFKTNLDPYPSSMPQTSDDSDQEEK